jgi:hypothetical protein
MGKATPVFTSFFSVRIIRVLEVVAHLFLSETSDGVFGVGIVSHDYLSI